MMMIESLIKHEIGSIVTIVKSASDPVQCRGKILREITEVEYIQNCLTNFELTEEDRELYVIYNNPNLHHYEIAED